MLTTPESRRSIHFHRRAAGGSTKNTLASSDNTKICPLSSAPTLSHHRQPNPQNRRPLIVGQQTVAVSIKPLRIQRHIGITLQNLGQWIRQVKLSAAAIP